MRIDLTQRLFNADDTVAEDAKTGKPLDLKHFLIQACLADFTGDRNQLGQQLPVAGEDKPKRYALYAELKKAGEFVNFSAEDIAVLKKASLVFPTLVVGQVHAMLEGESQNTSKKPRPGKPLESVQ